MTLPETDPPGERPKARWLKERAEPPPKDAASETGFRVGPRSSIPARTVPAPRTGVAPRAPVSPRGPSEPRRADATGPLGPDEEPPASP